MNNNELANKALAILKHKTLYCLGGFGQPLYKANQNRLINQYSYNKKRKSKIQAADKDTFAFDCIGVIKGIIWGWSAKNNATNGGATYKSNGLPDVSANSMIKLCKDVSSNFDNIQIGEFVWMDGHCGIYVGDDRVVESSPKWLNGVQISGINGRPYEGRVRTWTKHGKLPIISYEPIQDDIVAPVQQKKSLEEVALAVYKGEYGNAPTRQKRLKEEGYTDAEIKIIQKKVNDLASAKTTIPKESAIYYKAVAGDNLIKIARKYSTSVLKILELNPSIKDANKIAVGQSIRVK